MSNKNDLLCKNKRCQIEEAKQPGSTKLKLLKSWLTTGKGNVKMRTGIFQCPSCGKKTRHFMQSEVS